MNLSASKILLGISLVAYVYCLRGQIFGGSDKATASPTAAPAAAAGKELTAAIVNRNIPVKIGRDPFGAAEIALSKASTKPSKPLSAMSTTGPTTAPTTAPVVHIPIKLEGILIGPGGRAALINGKAIKEGESIHTEPGGPEVYAKEIGVDSVVVQSGNQQLRMHLPRPRTDDDPLPQQQTQQAKTPPPKGNKKNATASLPTEP